MPGGLLLGFSEEPVGDEAIAAYHAWYDEEHIPDRLNVPGISDVRRYQEIAHPNAYLATYDLDETGVLEREPYTSIRNHPSDREQRVTATLPLLTRRIYEFLPAPPVAKADADICGDFLLCVWWTPTDESEADFNAWYDEEHIGLLMTVPGWLRIRRYRLVTGDGPRYLAVHDLSTLDELEGPAHDVVNTPWRERVAAQRKDYDRRIYSLRRRFMA